MIDRETIIYTPDERIPLSDADRGMRDGWRMIPIPPADDPDLVIVDDRSDKKSGWMRRSQMPGAEVRH
jgi:hypothetical protein